MMQWLSRLILYPVFPGSNRGGGNVDSAFHPSEVGEMSSSIINGAQVCRGCADRQSKLLRQEFECTQPGLICAAE